MTSERPARAQIGYADGKAGRTTGHRSFTKSTMMSTRRRARTNRCGVRREFTTTWSMSRQDRRWRPSQIISKCLQAVLLANRTTARPTSLEPCPSTASGTSATAQATYTRHMAFQRKDVPSSPQKSSSVLEVGTAARLAEPVMQFPSCWDGKPFKALDTHLHMKYPVEFLHDLTNTPADR